MNVASLATDTPAPIARGSIDDAVTGCFAVLNGADRVSVGSGVLEPTGAFFDHSSGVEATFDPSLAGCWVRLWSQGFDFAEGRLFSMDGGGGKIRSDGAVSLVVLLPDGENAPRPHRSDHFNRIRRKQSDL